MTAHQTNAYLLQAREAGIAETTDPGASQTIRPGRRDRSYCVLTAGVGATTRVLSDPDEHPLDQEITLIAVGITGANTITITGLQGSTPTHEFTENGTAIFRVSLDGTTRVWLRIGPGAGSGSLADGDYGDVTVSDGGTTITIDDDTIGPLQIQDGAVTFSKIEDIATDRVLGRTTAGTGVVEEVPFLDPIQAIADDTSFAAIRQTLSLYDVAIISTADETATNDTDQDHTELQFSATNGDVWYCRLFLGVSGNNTTGDCALNVVTTGTWDNAASWRQAIRYSNLGALITTTLAGLSSTTVMVAAPGITVNNGDGTIRPLWLEFQIVMTGSGLVKVQFGQVTADVGRTTTIHKGATLLANRVRTA